MMGSVCCCFGVPDVDELANENSSNRGRSFLCSIFCVQGLLNKYQAIFERGSRFPVSYQEAVSSDSEVLHNGSSDTRSCDGTLPVDPNPRYSPVSGDAVVGVEDRGSSRAHVELEPFSAAVQQPAKTLKIEDKLDNAYKQAVSKECRSDSSLMVLSSVMLNGVEYFILSSEDEDVCPTCLEEYTEENPKIITHCSHHYHLSCIYEWMERSETCPICGKLMEFDE